MRNVIANERGVTLMEAMIYMAMAGMLLATAVTAFLAQNKSYNRQDVIAEIQQNIRGATEMMISDIRFAGLGLFDKTGKYPFTTADGEEIAVNLWDEDVGDAVPVRYNLDGTNLMRQYGTDASKRYVIASNIDKLRFEYLFENNASAWVWRNKIINKKDFDNIRAVKIIMLGSARDSAFNPTDPTVYRPPLQATSEPPWTPAPGTGHKRMISIVVQCRNNRG